MILLPRYRSQTMKGTAVKVSFHTLSYHYMDFDEVLAELAEEGYDGVGPAVGPEGHIDPANMEGRSTQDILRQVEKYGLELSILNPLGVPGLGEHEKRGDARSFYKTAIDLAADLGVKSVKFLSGSRTLSDSETMRNMITALRYIMPHAEKKGVYITMHNHEDMCLDTPDKMLLLEKWVDSPNLKICLDIQNVHHMGMDVPETIRRLGDRIVHVRVKGIHGLYPYSQFLVPGEAGDEVQMIPAAQALRDIGYDGFIEIVAQTWQPRHHSAPAYRHIARQLAEAGVRTMR